MDLDLLGLLLEPSGAAGLAAIQVHDLPGDRLATVLAAICGPSTCAGSRGSLSY